MQTYSVTPTYSGVYCKLNLQLVYLVFEFWFPVIRSRPINEAQEYMKFET